MKLQIMSLNLRYDKPDPGNNAWRVRREAVAALINYYKPDVIGTQEGKAHQLLDLHRLLPDYQSVGGDRTGTGSGEHCAIFYRTQYLTCQETKDFFLSDTPEVPGSISSEWRNPLPRMATWAVFAMANQPRKITVFNTHLDYESVKAREKGAELICDRMGKIDAAESLLFLTGDFNAAPGTLPRLAFLRPLPNGIQMLDALSNIDLDRQMAFHDFTGKAFAAIDTIYYDTRGSLRQAKVDNFIWQGIWPSDHFPAIADFTI